MNKTKEQIMREILDKAFGEIEQEEVLECMKIYAEQQAIGFANWFIDIIIKGESTDFTDFQLYDMYLKQKEG